MLSKLGIKDGAMQHGHFLEGHIPVSDTCKIQRHWYVMDIWAFGLFWVAGLVFGFGWLIGYLGFWVVWTYSIWDMVNGF